jgi:hypothetical protein
MDKKIIYIIGGVAVIGIGYYLYTRNKNKSASATTDGTATEGGETKSASAETGGDAPSGDAPAKEGQNIKDLKGKEKGAFRKDVRDMCREKYGRGKDYNQCKNRVKKGGVAFDGSDMQDEYYSGMTNDFDVSFR